MDREILFRAKHLNQPSRWIIGAGIHIDKNGSAFIWRQALHEYWEPIDPHTICSLAVSLPSNLLIFEKDVVCIEFHDGASFENDGFQPGAKMIGEIRYSACSFKFVSPQTAPILLGEILSVGGSDLSVIGTIFDNPELSNEASGRKYAVKINLPGFHSMIMTRSEIAKLDPDGLDLCDRIDNGKEDCSNGILRIQRV